MSQTMRIVKRATGLLVLAGLGVLLTGADPPRPQWTMDLDKMKVPDSPVTGRIAGADFKVERVKLDKIGALTLQQGREVIADASVVIFLPIKPGQPIAGKSWSIGAKEESDQRPSIHVERKPAPNSLPKMTVFTHDYALRLQFGQEKDGQVPGRIYLCLPDEARSVLAGTFAVPVK